MSLIFSFILYSFLSFLSYIFLVKKIGKYLVILSLMFFGLAIAFNYYNIQFKQDFLNLALYVSPSLLLISVFIFLFNKYLINATIKLIALAILYLFHALLSILLVLFCFSDIIGRNKYNFFDEKITVIERFYGGVSVENAISYRVFKNYYIVRRLMFYKLYKDNYYKAKPTELRRQILKLRQSGNMIQLVSTPNDKSMEQKILWIDTLYIQKF